ncbi:MAG: hypothetical protein L0229_16420 [Blastocatellia bacterium]|nr:hypothetical protein [Blastocatellia bacterium]
MEAGKRKYSLSIWLLAFGYFSFYIPYSSLIKAITEGSLSGASGSVSGLELLPSTVIATFIVMLLFITLMGWWKYAGRRTFFGLSIPFPSRVTFISGIGFAVIIATTTLAYSFNGVSIIFALLLLRGGVLIIAPTVDAVFKRRVRWFSWTALALSFTALGIAFSDVDNYRMTTLASLNLAAYLTGYLARLPCMTRAAKSREKALTYRYFVEEQLVAMPVLVAIPAIYALTGAGNAAMDLRRGFTTFLGSEAIIPALMIGIFYACLGICGTLIYLDRRENTFCIPLNRCSSLLSGVAASYALAFLLDQKPPSASQLVASGLVIIALLFLSPLHHLDIYIAKLKSAFAGNRKALPSIAEDGSRVADLSPVTSRLMPAARRVFLFVCGGNTFRSPIAQAICTAEIAARLNISADELSKAGIEVISAGVKARPGEQMKPDARLALARLCVTAHDHVSRSVTADMIEQAEAVYCMTEEQRRAILGIAPTANVQLLDPDQDIEEPHEGEGAAERFARRIQELIRMRFDGFERKPQLQG